MLCRGRGVGECGVCIPLDMSSSAGKHGQHWSAGQASRGGEACVCICMCMNVYACICLYMPVCVHGSSGDAADLRIAMVTKREQRPAVDTIPADSELYSRWFGATTANSGAVCNGGWGFCSAGVSSSCICPLQTFREKPAVGWR